MQACTLAEPQSRTRKPVLVNERDGLVSFGGKRSRLPQVDSGHAGVALKNERRF